MSRQEKNGKCRVSRSIQSQLSLIHMQPRAGKLAGAANLIKVPARVVL